MTKPIVTTLCAALTAALTLTIAPTAHAGQPSTAPLARAAKACPVKPNAANTGAHGTLRSSGRTVLGDGATLKNARVASLEIHGSDVRVQNVEVTGSILITGERVRLRKVTTQGIGISSALDVLVARSNIGYSPEDAIHVTSDGDRMVRNVRLRGNYIHHPRVDPEAHYDGTQVRGVDGMSITCSTYAPGPFQDTFNAAIYLENANGGSSHVDVSNNWLYGFAFSVMVDSVGSSFVDNRLGGDIKWDYCYLGKSSGSSGFESHGNTAITSGRRVDLCGMG